MRELQLITKAWDQLQESGESAVLATVVKTSGSAYRSPGARLLITPLGERYGSISGGCLEDDLIKKAWWLTESGRAVVKRYDTTSEGDVDPAFGLGCNGVVHVLVERLEPGVPNVLDSIAQVRSSRRKAVVARAIEPDTVVGNLLVPGGEGLSRESQLHEYIQSAAITGRSEFFELTDGQYFVEVLEPPIRVLIVGAGSDAVPVTELCRHLGWPVTVLDGRAHYARSERFPAADEVIQRTGGELRARVDERTAVVLMSHSYSQDCQALRELREIELPYLGVLGPRKRTEQLLSDAQIPTALIPRNLHSPIGLDIGADAPEQVALAVVAEIQASFNRRSGGLLRDKPGPIHARGAEVNIEESHTALR